MIPLRDVIPDPHLAGRHGRPDRAERRWSSCTSRRSAGTPSSCSSGDWGLVPADFAWDRVVTSMFLHGGWAHIGGNMLYLWIFGDNVEDRLGHGRYLVFYLLCGAVAALAQTYVNPDSSVPMIGASGAISGVLGAYIVLFPHSRVLTIVPIVFFIQLLEVPAIVLLGLWFLMQLLSGVGSLGDRADVGGVAFWAHVAGFVAGLGFVYVFKQPERQKVEWWDGVR